jgi:hypothetical protein
MSTDEVSAYLTQALLRLKWHAIHPVRLTTRFFSLLIFRYIVNTNYFLYFVVVNGHSLQMISPPSATLAVLC